MRDKHDRQPLDLFTGKPCAPARPAAPVRRPRPVRQSRVSRPSAGKTVALLEGAAD